MYLRRVSAISYAQMFWRVAAGTYPRKPALNYFCKMNELQEQFNHFADEKGLLDGRSFAKLCKDAGLVDAKFSTTDADLIFTKIKPHGGRKINFDTFRDVAIAEISQKKGTSTSDVETAIRACKGPKLNHVTHTEPVRFYDDKSLYTGVHAHGGPTVVDKGRTQVSDLSEITDRSAADVQGVKKGMGTAPGP